MKHLLIVIPAVILFNIAAAQNSSTAKTDNTAPKVYSLPDESGATEASISEINTKAVKHFATTFGNAKDISWMKVKDGSIVYFTLNDIKMKSAYRPNGSLACTIRYYGEDQLPKSVRRLVKTNYFDFDISQVIEIKHDNEFIYIVKLQDEKSLKTVRVSNGEIQVLEEYKRG